MDDSLTSWFVRRKAAAPPAQDADAKQQKGKGKEKAAATAATPTAGKKPSNPVTTAVVAVATAAAEKLDRKAAAVATPASDKKPANAAEAGDKKAASTTDKKAPAVVANRHGPAGAAAAAIKKAATNAVMAAAADKPPASAAGSGDDKKHKAAAAAAAGHHPAHHSATDSDSDNELPAVLPGAASNLEQGHSEQQQAAEKEKERERERELFDEAEYRPRVVAYSDSDSDVESHFKRVKTHLLPPSGEETAERAAAGAAAAAAAAAEEAAAVEAARRRTGFRRMQGAVGGAAGAAGRSLGPHLTAGLAARASGLLVLGHMHSKAAYAAGVLGAAVPLASAAAVRAGLDLAQLPGPLLAASQEMEQLGKAAVAAAAARLLHAGLQCQRRRRLERQQRRLRKQAEATEHADAGTATEGEQLAELSATPGHLLRRKSSVNLAALRACADLGAAIEERQPQTAAEWAAVYGAEIQEMKRMLQENEVELPADRYDATNAELLRFAKACNLLTAKTPEQRAAAVEAGVSRVVHTQEWAARQRFMPARELRRWERLVAWKAHDASGRPILLCRIGRAQQLVKPERYADFAAALLTLVHRGLTTQLSNTNGPAEQMVVVLDCRGGSSIGLTRHMGLLKKLAVTMNQHYPDRLFRLHLLELPLLLRWALHAVMPLLHPNTRAKVVLSSMSDPGLHVTVAFLSKRRSVAKSGGMRHSSSNCSFLSSGDATPALLSPQLTASSGLLPALVAASAAGTGTGACGSSSGAAEKGRGLPLGHQLADDDSPNTPPPTLKAPHSPREVLKSRQQRQQQQQQEEQEEREKEEAGHSQQQWAVALGPSGAERAQRATSSPFASKTSHPQSELTGATAALDLSQPAASRGMQASNSTSAPATVAAAAEALAPAASACQGLISHAVPWSPACTISRDSSYGNEAVPAATAKAAADAVREVEQAQEQHCQPGSGTAALEPRQQAAQAASSSRRGSLDRLNGQLAQPPLHRLDSEGSCSSLPPLPSYLSAPPSMPSQPVASSGSSAIKAGMLGSWFGGLLQGQRGTAAVNATATKSNSSSAEQGGGQWQQQLCLPMAGLVAGGDGGSAGCTPRHACQAAVNPGRLTPGRPAKSSLRRSESADSLPSSRSRLGSHPLRRQSSVSWAEELECILEIRGREVAPLDALRSKLATAAHPHLLLLAGVLSLLMAALLQRLLLRLTV